MPAAQEIACHFLQDHARVLRLLDFVVAGLYGKAQRYGVPGARPAGLRGYLEPRVTRPRPRNDIRNKPFTGYRNKYISQNFMIRGIFTEVKVIAQR